jgi:CBS domain-containing membrane protein
MDERDDICKITEEDLRASLREVRTFVDVSAEDLRRIFQIAVKHARDRRAPRLTVKRTMTMEVVTVKRETDIRVAADLLTKHRISGMPVVDGNDVVVGVLSEADILALAGIKRGHGFKDILHRLLGEPAPVRTRTGTTAGEVMSAPPITTGPDADIREVAAVLDERRIKRLPVVDDGGRLIGVISRADIVRIMGREPDQGRKKTRRFAVGRRRK